MVHLEQTTLMSNAVKNKILVDTETGTHRANAKVEIEKAIIDAQLKKRLQELGTRDVNWDEGAWQI